MQSLQVFCVILGILMTGKSVVAEEHDRAVIWLFGTVAWLGLIASWA